jgi:hypothetical protein
MKHSIFASIMYQRIAKKKICSKQNQPNCSKKKFTYETHRPHRRPRQRLSSKKIIVLQQNLRTTLAENPIMQM